MPDENDIDILTRRQRLERRRLDIIQHPAFTDTANLLYRHLQVERQEVERQLLQISGQFSRAKRS